MNPTGKLQVMFGLLVATALIVATVSLNRVSSAVGARSQDASPSVETLHEKLTDEDRAYLVRESVKLYQMGLEDAAVEAELRRLALSLVPAE